MMIVVYIAGPFRAESPWCVEQNVRRAELLALEVWSAGAVALCPHLNTRYYSGALHDSVWLHGDEELLLRCDAVLTVDGWENSQGALSEVALARRNGMSVFHSIGEFLEWQNSESSKQAQRVIPRKAS